MKTSQESSSERTPSICFITGIFPPDIGGPATYMSELASSLYQKQHDVMVITLGEASNDYPFPVKRVSRSHALPVRLFLLFWTLVRYGWRSDVWYINGLEFPAVFAGKLLRKRMVMKIVGDYAWERAMNNGLTDASIDDFQRKKQIRNVELHKSLRSWYTRQVNSVITPSRYLKELVTGWGVPEERIHVIYNSIEKLPEDLNGREDVRKQLGISEREHLLVTVGRLVRWKGMDQLIEILGQLDSSVTLLIVGDGPEKNKLTDLAGKLNVSERVKFTGKVNRNQALAHINASDVFILNTGYEGFSHVLLETMMTGTPVITTPVCGNPELVTHQKNGLLIKQGDRDSLKEAIEQLLHDAVLRKTCVEEGKRTAEHYSWNRLLQQTETILYG